MVVVMAATESTMLGLGTPAPAFQLPDAVSGQTVNLDSFPGKKGLLVMFLCPHCPYVRHIHSGLAALARDYASADLGMVAISSNDAAQYPDDGPDGLRKMAQDLGFQFPYCYDENQETAQAYQAACTPDFFLFDADRRLVYRGQFDDSRPKNSVPVTGSDLRAAIDAVLAGQAVSALQKPSIGCNIKWKPGKEPAYYR
jgi:thiol-disulfide isomerase/thioredoxin